MPNVEDGNEDCGNDSDHVIIDGNGDGFIDEGSFSLPKVASLLCTNQCIIKLWICILFICAYVHMD